MTGHPDLPKDDSKYNVLTVLRVLVGVLIGVPLGVVLAEVRRGRRAGPDAPPFAVQLADAPRQPGEWL